MTFRYRSHLLGLLLLAILTALPARADDLPAVGAVLTGSVPILGKQVPLPDGQWRVVSRGFGQINGHDPGPYGAIGGVLLVRPTPDADRSFVLVHTNALPVREGWGSSPVCDDKANLFNANTEPHDLHHGCGFVTFQRDPARRLGPLPALQSPEAAAALPPWALIAGAQTSDRRDIIDIRLGIAPAQPDPSAWPGMTAETTNKLDNKHQDVLRRLADWAMLARQTAEAMMRGPAAQAAALPYPDLESARKPVTVSPEEMTAVGRAAWKFASYRILNTATSFVLATYVTGNVAAGGLVTAWNIITHSMVFLTNELVWEWPTPVPAMALVASGSAPAAAPSAAALPPTYDLGGKKVPLPPGTWTALVRRDSDNIAAVVLAQRDGRTLTGLVIARTNIAPTSNIIGTAPDCGRWDLYFAVTRFDTPRDGYCTYAKRIVPQLPPPANETNLWHMAADRLTGDAVTLPPAMFEVGARARTREHFLDVRYYFANEADVSTWPGKADTDPATQARVDSLRAWADLLQEPMERGLRAQAPVGGVALPAPMPIAAVDAALSRQIRAPLHYLRAAGAIDEAAYESQLKRAERDALFREQQRWSLWTRSLVKVATYRAGAYLDTIATTWVVLGNVGQAFSLANLNAVVKPVVAYGNEVGWAAVGIGRPREALLSASFGDIGPDRP